MSEMSPVIASSHNSPIKTAVIGAGAHGEGSHINIIRELPDFNIVTIADTSPYRRDQLQRTAWVQEAGVSVTGDPVEAMEYGGLDAVIIASPDREHNDQMWYAITRAQNKKGLHVLGEKPLATNVKEAGRTRIMLDMARAENQILLPCFPRRFGEPWRSVHNMVHDPTFLEETFGVSIGQMGLMKSIEFDAHYTAGDPAKHASFGLDKDPHNVNSAVDLAGAVMFEDVFIRLDGPTEFRVDSTAITRDHHKVTVTSQGRRQIPKDRHLPSTKLAQSKRGIYRDTVRISFERGDITADSLGRLTINHDETNMAVEDSRYATNYDKEFAGLHQHFADLILGRTKTRLISETGTALAALSFVLAQEEYGGPITAVTQVW